MAHVGDEVAPDRLYATGLGEVLDQEQHQPGAQRGDPGGDGEGVPAAGAAPGEVQLDLPYLAVPPGVAGHVEHRLDGEATTSDQAQRIGGGAGLDDAVALVEHDGGGAEHGEDGVHTGRQSGVAVGPQ